MKKKNSKKLIFILSTAILIFSITAAAVSCMALPGPLGSNNKEAASGIETFTVKKDSIVSSLSSTGTLDSNEKKNLAVQISGEILEVASEGSSFKKGDILMKVDNTKTLLQIQQAADSVETAEISLKKAQLDYQAALDANHIAVQVANEDMKLSELSSEDAYTAIENSSSAGSISIESAENSLQNAQTSFNNSVSQAQLSLDQANKQLELIKLTNPTAIQLNQYESAVTSSQLAYNSTVANATSSINSASSSLEQAEQQAGTNTENAESAYEKALIGQSKTYWSTLSSLETAEKQIKATMLSLESSRQQVEAAKLSLEIAQLDIDNNIVEAPFDGIVLSCESSTGEMAGSSSVIAVASSDYILKSSINETDIPKIFIGNPVKIIFDSYSDIELTGEISNISQSPVVSSNITSYEISVKMQFPEDINLFYGMTASITIESVKAENVLVVPYLAVYEEGGKQFVDILLSQSGQTETQAKGEQPSSKKVEITTGESNYTYYEVTSGLSEGDIVVVSGLSSEASIEN